MRQSRRPLAHDFVEVKHRAVHVPAPAGRMAGAQRDRDGLARRDALDMLAHEGLADRADLGGDDRKSGAHLGFTAAALRPTNSVLSSNEAGRRSSRNSNQTSGHKRMVRPRRAARCSGEWAGMRPAQSPSVIASTASRPPVAAIRRSAKPAAVSSRSSANGVKRYSSWGMAWIGQMKGVVMNRKPPG